VARVVAAALLLGSLAQPEAPRVRGERGRYWIQCQSAPLEEILREIADLSPMELWLDEELSQKRVTATVERATLRQALEEIFEQVAGVNYVLAFDPTNPEKVTKIYAGAGGGRLGREPTKPARRTDPLL
jgi:type II secretory pathway component GspD/PulD (secretin)